MVEAALRLKSKALEVVFLLFFSNVIFLVDHTAQINQTSMLACSLVYIYLFGFFYSLGEEGFLTLR